MRRVVVTGLGMISPFGRVGVDFTWQNLLSGESSANQVTNIDVSDIASQIACQIPRGDGSDGTFNPDDWVHPKEQRKVGDFHNLCNCCRKNKHLKMHTGNQKITKTRFAPVY